MTVIKFAGRFLIKAALWRGCSLTEGGYLTLCDMCSGVSISSKMAPFTLEPRRFASWRSQPDRSQFCSTKKKWRSEDMTNYRTILKLNWCALTSRSVPARVAPRKLQFLSLAFFSVATRRFIPVIWLPSISTPFRLAPVRKWQALLTGNMRS